MTTAPGPADIPPGALVTDAEWDLPTLAYLAEDDGPHTTGELVLIPGYTQTGWERRMVRWLNLGQACEAYLWDNLHKTNEVLVRDLLLLLGYGRAARAHMATVTPEPICAELAAPAKPKRVRPSRARKAVTGPGRDPR